MHKLILNVTLLNLVSDQSYYNVRQASLVLIAKTLECTGMRHALRPPDFSSALYPGSANDIAYRTSDDIANNTTEDVHNFILEFVKTMTYLNQNDFSIISSFITSCMIHCGNEAIKNNTTLDTIAQIAAAIQ